MAKSIAGKKSLPVYKIVSLSEIVGKTIEAAEHRTVEGANGDEPCIDLFFTDGTMHGFILPSDNWDE